MSGRRSRVSRNPERSRGRALPNAIRDAMRSMSTVFLSSVARRRNATLSACRSMMAAWRAAATSRLRTGFASHCRNKRLPAPVTHVSSSDSNVGPRSPRSVCVISRLRRVAASSATSSSSRSTTRLRTCANADCCVTCAYCISAPAAATASGTSLAPNALRSWVPSCSHICCSGRHSAGSVVLLSTTWTMNRG